MCFGSQETGSKTTTPNVNPAYQSAAQGNLNLANQIQSTPYQAYSGPRVADFSGLQNQSFDTAAAIGGSTNPYQGQSQDLINQYASTPASSVNANSISSNMSPYMSQYVGQALQPTLQQMQMGFNQQNKADDAAATSSGAYGDARAGIQKANTGFLQNIMGTGTVANAYNTAFNTAIGAGAQDSANSLQAQTTNANLNETALQRALGGSQALTSLGTSALGNNMSAAQFQQQMGGIQQQQQQANLNVPYSNYLAAQQYPYLQLQAGNSAVSGNASAFPSGSTQTTYAPDNSGLQLGGAIIGGMFSDIRLKENIMPIGKLDKSGLPIYLYNYKGQNTPQIGLMAQDVEKVIPDAVGESHGYKTVNYAKATALDWAPAV